MQKGLVFVVIFAVLALGVSAFSLADITGWFVAWFAEPSSPEFVTAFVNPVKVRPGEQLVITAAVKDAAGIESVVAEVEHEKGNDSISMLLVAGNKKTGTYQAAWVVHDTNDQKWYNITITATNVYGLAATILVEYQDPTVTHAAEQIRPGSFTEGQYIFPSTSTVGIGATPTQALHVAGSANITGNLSVAGAANVTGNLTVRGNLSVGSTVVISGSDITCSNCIGGADVDESSLSGTASSLTAGAASNANACTGDGTCEATALTVSSTASITSWASQSLATSGYAQMGSVKIQWGRNTNMPANEGTFTVSFPTSFSSVFNMQCTVNQASWDVFDDVWCQVVSVGTSSATLAIQGSSAVPAEAVYWTAIGT